jgi:hypothetical protein
MLALATVGLLGIVVLLMTARLARRRTWRIGLSAVCLAGYAGVLVVTLPNVL